MRTFLKHTAFYGILVLAGFELLFQAGFVPVVTDSTYFDHKMAWVRQHPLPPPQLILVGSSVPLYGVQSGPIVRQLPLSFYNFCSWRMRIADCGIVVPALVQEYRPKYVVLGSNLGDFCGLPDSTYLNYTRISPAMRQRLPELWYFLDFHPIHQIVYRRLKSRTVRFDRYGGGDWAFDRSLSNGPLADLGVLPEPLPFDLQNQGIHYRALDSMSRWLRDRGVKLIFVQFPVNEGGGSDNGGGGLVNGGGGSVNGGGGSVIAGKGSANGGGDSVNGGGGSANGGGGPVDPVRALVEKHIRTCQAIVVNDGGIFLNYCDSLRGRDSLFAGPIHLKPLGAESLTNMLVRDLGKITGGRH